MDLTTTTTGSFTDDSSYTQFHVILSINNNTVIVIITTLLDILCLMESLGSLDQTENRAPMDRRTRTYLGLLDLQALDLQILQRWILLLRCLVQAHLFSDA
uniref:Uncharacterized protein n=1 Tax=Heterorhabditis bacteriophora TaxID=37862 RepID=A0A1I7WTV4_HETBA